MHIVTVADDNVRRVKLGRSDRASVLRHKHIACIAYLYRLQARTAMCSYHMQRPCILKTVRCSSEAEATSR